ncbi:DivIVA domain-containing protein [Acidimicrobiia bacterium EGI L10123]|uniref:DivIVA domain-containing protein n=1 Tax=Salinilacustrithrix flava TaxID=2957203 RepID=UPI003D7C3606|nr:DivIVA domain-containing protein [Acidimicrobiia bacterium EGI L10123]
MTDDPRIDPADLRNVRFPGSSRRYDARAVDQFLETVAARIAATNELVDELQARIAEIDTAAPVAAPAPPPPELALLDDDELVSLVGAETASVLSTARRAAEEIRSKAEESAARMIREATAEADKLTDEAKATATALTTDAEHALEQATTEATAEAERIRTEAAEDAERTRAEATGAIEAERAAADARRAEAEEEAETILAEARDEGRGMVNEAKEVRTRILEDLQRRRDIARDHIERLLDGRERLLAAYGLVRENLDDITGQLADALPDPGEPELPDGFVGIVGANAPTADADEDGDDGEVTGSEGTVDEDRSEGEDQPDEAETTTTADAVEADAVEPDDTVAPITETEADIEGVDDAVDEPAAPDEETEPEAGAEPEAEADAEVEDHEATELDADEADAHTPGGDVDELFARLRAEREESVAKARQVVDAGTDAAEVEPDAVAAADDDTVAAVDAVEDDTVEGDTVAAGDEPAEEAQAEDRPGGDVDRVPAEFLADEPALLARADALGPLETKLNRALKRRLADEQNELLDLLRRSGTTTAAELLPDLPVQVDGYARLAEKHLQAAATAGGQAAGSEVAADVTALARALGAALVEPFRRRVERSASEVDGDPDELDERLRALYREWKVQHIGPVADDALLSAYALGTLTAAKPDGRVRWLIDPSQGPCPDAQDNALAGEVGAGEPFPTGDPCPQAHPGCRCLLVTG